MPGRETVPHLRDHPRSRVADVAATFAAGIGAIRLDELIAPAVSAGQLDAARTALAALRQALEDARLGLPAG